MGKTTKRQSPVDGEAVVCPASFGSRQRAPFNVGNIGFFPCTRDERDPAAVQMLEAAGGIDRAAAKRIKP